jgi:hypothetical protein
MSMFQLIKDSVTELTNPPHTYFASKIEMAASSNDDHIDETRSEISKLVHNFVDGTIKVYNVILIFHVCHNIYSY